MRALLLTAAVVSTTALAGPDAGVPAAALTEVQVTQALGASCTPCHAVELVEQQRITQPQWLKTLKKMKTFGALVDDAQLEPLAAALAAKWNPSVPDVVPPRVKASEVHAQFRPLPDGPFAKGDAKRGEALFQARCAVCHGPAATGLIGVNLVDRLLLYRAAEVAATVRSGRGVMPPAPDLTDANFADLLAWLRSRKP